MKRSTASHRHNGPFPDENLIFRPKKASINSTHTDKQLYTVKVKTLPVVFETDEQIMTLPLVERIATEAVGSDVIFAMDGS